METRFFVFFFLLCLLEKSIIKLMNIFGILITKYFKDFFSLIISTKYFIKARVFLKEKAIFFLHFYNKNSAYIIW